MEDPAHEIPKIIHLLTQTPPSLQRATLQRYFTPDAEFVHPFCRTGSFTSSQWTLGRDSRDLIGFVYRWYKILSPRIDLAVESVAWDEKNLLLYVSLRQNFRIWLLAPVYSGSHVKLTTVLELVKVHSGHAGGDGDEDLPAPPRRLDGELVNGSGARYLIKRQNDLYQTDQFVRFVSPWGVLTLLLVLGQFVSTAGCVLGALLLWPVTWFEEQRL